MKTNSPIEIRLNKSIFTILAPVFALVFQASAQAASADCVPLQIGSIKQIQTKPISGFTNCFFVDSPNGTNNAILIGQSYNLSAFNIRELKQDSSGQLSTDADNWSDADATLIKKITKRGRIFFSVRPAINDKTPKNITINTSYSDGVLVTHFAIQDVISASAPPEDTCTNPRKQCSRLTTRVDKTSLASCSPAATPPSDKNPISI